ATPAAESSDEISEDEFEHLLDELHGEGKFKAGTNSAAVAVEPIVEPAPVSVPAAKPAPVAETPAPAPTPEPAPVAAKKVEKEKAAAPDIAKDKLAKAGKDSAPQGETTVRVDTKRLDDIMNMVGELVLARNRLVTLQSTIEGNEEFAHAIANLDLVTADLQTSVMKTRMQPIKKVFGRFPRVVRDLARSLKKEVSLELRGEETDLDKNLVEALADPLVHLVRNAVDHGIEDPDTRAANGKSREGTVILSAEQEGDHILLTIQDDGAGMDPDKLRRLAVEKGVMDAEAASRLDDRDAYSLIFAPGFSTKEEISDISGRGVGMDVVKTRIVQLNGSIEIDSTLGKGTLLSIKVPLTLAIMPTLMVMLGAQIFALPLVSVSEIFNLDLTNTNKVDGQKVIMLRERALPIYFLSDWLEKEGRHKDHPTNGHVVVVSVGDQRVGFVVETLIGQEEVVIKPLGALLHGTKGLAGATITGDGRIALILDVPSLMKAYVRR
ncbi:MAG: chemotaxis protein CheA, partial [Gammaproteobacteria bacterium]|nr:chemotaxis protein CheA [Gammaproteobacteria bacterium]